MRGMIAILLCAAAWGGGMFHPDSCLFAVPPGANVRCGWLTVPEDRSKAESRSIRLHIAIYKSRSPRPAADPILWLVGGPGGRANAVASRLYTRVVEPYLGKRDFIVMDVRGTGHSEPALDCPNGSGPPIEWMRECARRLTSHADLACYNTSAAASDVADLRRALGLREWNLLGESYGTRLALAVLRDHPEGIRSVVLDSVVPIDADQYADGPSNFENALEALFSGCASDSRCHASFPELRKTLIAAAVRLDRSPRRLTGSWHGIPYDFRLDGTQLMEALHMALYESDLIPQVPGAIYHAADGGADALWSEVLGRHLLFVARELVDRGAYLSFHCAEGIPFADVARLKAEDAKRPWLRHAGSGISDVEACGFWPAKPLPARETHAVRSNTPALLLAGEYDPVTPPAYARSVASQLRNSHLFVFPRLGHWLTANTVTACPQTVVLDFVESLHARPSPACIQEGKPRWDYR